MAGFQVDMSPLVNSSINMGNAYRGIGQQLGGAIQNAGNMYAQNQQQEQQQTEVSELVTGAMNGSPESMQALMANYPDAARNVAQQIQQQQAQFQGQEARAVTDMDAATLEANQKTIKNIYAIQNLKTPEEREKAFNTLIDDPNDVFDADDMEALLDPKNLRAESVFYFGEDEADAMFGGGGDAVSISAADAGFNDLIKDFTPAQQKTAKMVRAGLEGRAMSNAELSAIKSGDIKSYSDYKVKQKQAEKFAELTGSSRARAIDAGVEKIQKIDIGVKNIDKAISLLESDAGVGAIEKWLPSIKASTVALNNLQSTMALDVIGAVTFGALSQGELDLAKNVALNTKLDTPDLIADLQARKSAQEKLRAYFNEQIQHLDQGGTKASFMRKKEREMEQGNTGDNASAQENAPQQSNDNNQALQWAQANPNDPRAAQIMQKLQGAQ